MDGEYSFIDRYFRHVSTQRLVFYGIALLSIIVVGILLLTLLPGGDDYSSSAQEKPAGHTALESVPLVDGHNNLPVLLMQKLMGAVSSFPFNSSLNKNQNYSWSETDLPGLKKGLVGTQVWTIKSACTSQYKDAVAKTSQQLDAIIRLIDKYKNDMKLITTSSDIDNAFKEKKIGSILALKGGLAIDSKLAILRMWSRIGVKIMSLNSECKTPWAASYTRSNTSKLVFSDFGQVVIKEMNRLGMIIDIAGSFSDTQLKVLEESKAPCIFTNVAAYALTANERNVKNSLLDAIKKNKALIMISLDSTLLVDQETKKAAQIYDVAAHINFWRVNVGVDNVGLGSGFNSDGRLAVQGLENSSKFPSLFDRLAKPQFKNETEWTIDELKKLAGLNFLRVFAEVEKVRDGFTMENPYENLIPDSDIGSLDKSCYTST